MCPFYLPPYFLLVEWTRRKEQGEEGRLGELVPLSYFSLRRGTTTFKETCHFTDRFTGAEPMVSTPDGPLSLLSFNARECAHLLFVVVDYLLFIIENPF